MDDLIIEKINNGYVLYYTSSDRIESTQKVYFSDKETLFNFIDQILE